MISIDVSATSLRSVQHYFDSLGITFEKRFKPYVLALLDVSKAGRHTHSQFTLNGEQRGRNMGGADGGRPVILEVGWGGNIPFAPPPPPLIHPPFSLSSV